jgi:hypothetical protein
MTENPEFVMMELFERKTNTLLQDEEVLQKINTARELGGFSWIGSAQHIPGGERIEFHVPHNAQHRWFEETEDR